MTSGTGRTRVRVNREMFSQIASSPQMAAWLLERAEAGKAAAEAIAPEYTGPTWGSATRAGNYKRSLNASLERSDFGYRSEFGADVDYAVQVEFGTGSPGSTPAGGRARDSRGRFTRRRTRPQRGWSPKNRVLGRALDTLRST